MGPTWREVIEREYEHWDPVDVRIDTARRVVEDSSTELRETILAQTVGERAR
jgi:hypothetical protein